MSSDHCAVLIYIRYIYIYKDLLSAPSHMITCPSMHLLTRHAVNAPVLTVFYGVLTLGTHSLVVFWITKTKGNSR